MTVEIVEPGPGTVVEATVDAAPVLEIFSQDSATVEVLPPDDAPVVEVVTAAPAVIEVIAAEDPAPTVEVVLAEATTIEVVAPGPDSGGGVVDWGSIVNKPSVFPPEEHTTEVITDFSTSVQTVLDTHINDPTPHPAYDDMPSLTLLYENGLI